MKKSTARLLREKKIKALFGKKVLDRKKLKELGGEHFRDGEEFNQFICDNFFGDMILKNMLYFNKESGLVFDVKQFEKELTAQHIVFQLKKKKVERAK